MRVIVFFCLFSQVLFSQIPEPKGSLWLQLGGGNDFYMKPYTLTNAFAPRAEVLAYSTADKDSARNVHPCYIIGVDYSRSQQVLEVLWAGISTGAAKSVSFYTNEYLLTVGGGLRYNLGARCALLVPLLFQCGQNYTWADTPEDKMLIGGMRGHDLWEDLAAPAGPHYVSAYQQAYYRWAYLQLYLTPGIQLWTLIGKGFAFYAGVQSRFFLMTDYEGDEPASGRLNYAPAKLALQAGLMLKFSK